MHEGKEMEDDMQHVEVLEAIAKHGPSSIAA
jgi:hypothetical protein